MKSFWKIFLIFLTIASLGFCNSRKDNSLERALFNYIAFCNGGTLQACKNGCGEEFGTNVTTENLSQINSCFSRCDSNCNLQNILLLIEAAN